MTRCPKCGGIRIGGPHYEPAAFFGDRDALRYTCRTCGYSTTTPTKDAEEEDRG